VIVIIKSQCGKKALIETRRVLDQFFERAGDRTWEGPVTQEGLKTVRMLLRKTARRNTAVVCHRVRGRHQVEMEWIVGNARKFNEEGRVPTNSTGRDVLRSASENQWHTAEAIALMAGIAGLFHDFGKANVLFQKKLQGKRGMQEPLRHEWLSLLMFVAFVRGKSDREWLEALANIQPDDDRVCLTRLAEFQQKREDALNNPFIQLAGMPLAQTIGWLIVSHHRLPVYAKWAVKDKGIGGTELRLQDALIDSNKWDAFWNSPQWKSKEWQTEEWRQLFTFADGTPIKSPVWCRKACQLAKRAQHLPSLSDKSWLQDTFTSHLARLSLMLADHSYSAGPAVTQWQSSEYKVFANTRKDPNGKRHNKQHLDEHNIGVGQNALLLARQLPRLREQLPVLVSHKGLKQRTRAADYRWQNSAFDLARSVSERSSQQGFFGVNMASTGKGKTFANARIMYGLANEYVGCRFCVALGLRTLTLQTGDALRERLRLDSDELAVLVGSQAVQQLHQLRQQENSAEAPVSEAIKSGSESSEDLLDNSQHISYDGTLDDGPLRRWLGQKDRHQPPSKLLKLLSAPVLVSTIDHLMPATEGVRGGKQIAPMLRLLTSDLVLDEPDDFDSADLPALCRLVNWAGMLGSRVLLSSASLPPIMVTALFDAYLAGRKHYDRACGHRQGNTSVVCGWFDEFLTTAGDCDSADAFKEQNASFVSQRIAKLKPELAPGRALRRAAVLSVVQSSTVMSMADAINAITDSCLNGMQQLHSQHGETDPVTGKTASVGLIRMANINPLVAVARQLRERALPEGWRLNLCVYHSQFPLLVRSHIEKRLDSTLDRHLPEQLWRQPEVRAALDNHPEPNQLFVVLGSPVTEVGRDHDYNWAIAEPSSMRSLIQLAGRIQRHRKQPSQTANMLVLEKNIRALTTNGSDPVYCKPGFEAKGAFKRNSDGSCGLALPNLLMMQPQFRAISAAIPPQDLASISSIPRLEQRKRETNGTSLVDIEHLQLGAVLMSRIPFLLVGKTPADLWWALAPSPVWHAEIQRRSPFRQSTADDGYVLYLEDETEQPIFHQMHPDNGTLVPVKDRFECVQLAKQKACCNVWLETDVKTLVLEISERLEREVADVSRQFCEIRLRRINLNSGKRWHYHPWLGVFQEIR
jgi:CRISPR-associated endonuclease/helicase Cas3